MTATQLTALNHHPPGDPVRFNGRRSPSSMAEDAVWVFGSGTAGVAVDDAT
ncbi:MAG: hypothetical protein WBP28_04865 [Nostocoides sp.]